MKEHAISAAIIALTTLATYPFLNDYAEWERGYKAIGGEELWLVFGFFVAFMVICRVAEQSREANEKRPTRK